MDEEKKEEKLIEERKKKLKEIFSKSNVWVIVGLIIAVILGVYIRSMPMQDHGGKPGLWDITTNDWTLGPDLDPLLFLRYAKEMINGNYARMDMMRNVPLGFDTSTELQMVSYMIVLTYKIVNLLGSYSINFAAAFMPVLLFALTIIVFFLFVREIFIRKNEKNTKANLIALISTFFMVVIPVFLSRTVAGIPEKESVGFFFMFLAFYLFLRAWKSEKLKYAIILGILAGISTALMGLTWGGVIYIYVSIGIAGLLAFVLNKFHKKETLVYSSWLFASLAGTLLFTNRVSLIGFFTSIDTGLSIIVIFIATLHLVLWKTRFAKIKFFEESRLPRNLWSLIIGILLIMIISVIFLGPTFIIEKLNVINQMTFKPVTGRWSQTVAENRQPYFTEWGGSFGPFIRGIPVMFWLFFIGSVVLFKNMLSDLKKKDAWILTALFIFFLFGMIFSRYAPHPNLMDGEGFASKLFYYGSGLILICCLGYYYIRYHKEKIEGFEKINYELLFLLSLFVLCLFTARSAVRLIMVLGPIAPIFVSYLIVESFSGFKRNKNDETKKIFWGIIAVLILILSLFAFWTFYKQVKGEAYSFVPNYYTQQWQKAMSWVRNETPSNAVFAHWWDYGYWLQSIGNRATVTDGGNAIVYWNYLTGRLVLTGDNEKDALEFLYNHNASYLLIDSSDIGKYGAYAIIGSDENSDRSSWIPVMGSDDSRIQETKEGVMRVYQGGSGLDEDLIYTENGTRIVLLAENTGLAGMLIEVINKNNSKTIKQPNAVFISNGRQLNVPLRYAYYNKKFIDFGKGIEGAVRIVSRVNQNGQGIQLDNEGVLIYISPRVLRGMMAQVYLLNDPFKKFQNFKIAHSEQSIIVDSLNQQGANIDEFAVYGDIHGPIKIWGVNYRGDEKIKQEYLDKDASKYLDWQL